MSSWLNTTATLQNVTTLPAGISIAKALEVIQNHNLHMQCDPHMVKYESIPRPSKVETPTIPANSGLVAVGEPEYYCVTDKVHTLPAGLWDSNVESTNEFVNLEKGVFVRLYSPLNVVMETVWTVRENGNGGIELVEDVLIKASRLLVGTVKNMCSTNWTTFHGKIVNLMKEGSSSSS
ncbi:uncharacterized protein TRIVIDRAFT_64362 [Trichoderma virens Gv29-8]|uniref:DUF7053 domain-containing protein n=1 Tax=Hypocrea virens (strain Gv29-8 / FGSC 10586) TaxID=413071 RepID=G9NDI8_HYPVG|nr:uncharacterized protein TRIVIDRAFT_64362 [Trichoderma virens Gv29-8]EHK15755.1 hypothetical protein TRIVIDRAFT_64362 [Trichoderma virens Gv29-8]UKZ51698.1 hypothetical protein TrVGV298_005461 [Trichoderma virens]